MVQSTSVEQGGLSGPAAPPAPRRWDRRSRLSRFCRAELGSGLGPGLQRTAICLDMAPLCLRPCLPDGEGPPAALLAAAEARGGARRLSPMPPSESEAPQQASPSALLPAAWSDGWPEAADVLPATSAVATTPPGAARAPHTAAAPSSDVALLAARGPIAHKGLPAAARAAAATAAANDSGGEAAAALRSIECAITPDAIAAGCVTCGHARDAVGGAAPASSCRAATGDASEDGPLPWCGREAAPSAGAPPGSSSGCSMLGVAGGSPPWRAAGVAGRQSASGGACSSGAGPAPRATAL